MKQPTKMYKKIIFNKNLPLKQRLKNLITYWSKRRGARIGWNNRFKKVFGFNPELRKQVDKISEKNHKKYWGGFSNKA